MDKTSGRVGGKEALDFLCKGSISVTMKLSVLGFLALAALTLVLSGCGGESEAEKHFFAGYELAEQGRFEEAIGEYDEAIRLDPQDADAYNNRGVSYENLGQFQRAIQDHDEAIRLDPQPALAYSNRGTVYGNLDSLVKSLCRPN